MVFREKLLQHTDQVYLSDVLRGVSPKILDFLCLDIFCSPTYLVSKMGTFAPPLTTVAEIGRVRVGPYAHFFAKMYAKLG